MEKFECFNIYKDLPKYIFIEPASDIPNKTKAIFKWAFTDEKLLRYAGIANSKYSHIEKCQKKQLFLALKRFIDDENSGKIPFDEKYNAILDVLKDEKLVLDDGKTIEIRNDKVGKMGEYIFYNLLSDYFKYVCILNKANLSTSYNMSVYGMDELFYDKDNNILLFGESKFCEKIENGIALINSSIKEYDERLDSEYELIFSSPLYGDTFPLPDEMKKKISETITFDDFVNEMKIEKIGIPIFIMHGGNLEKDKIFEKLDNIKKPKIHGLETVYIIISLPVQNKSGFSFALLNEIERKIEL